jgi:hypothetical protein
MESDGVSTAFSIIMDEISAVEEQLNEEGSNAFKKSQYSDAQRLSEAGKSLGTFREKLEVLRDEWNSGIDISTRKRVKVEHSMKPHTKRKRVKVESGYTLKPHTKSEKTNLRITMQNGRVIQPPSAAQAMVEAIEEFGIEKVRNLGHTVCGVDLVSKSRHEKYNQNTTGDYFICTHSCTKNKQNLLLEIAESLGQKITVEIV